MIFAERACNFGVYTSFGRNNGSTLWQCGKYHWDWRFTFFHSLPHFPYVFSSFHFLILVSTFLVCT